MQVLKRIASRITIMAFVDSLLAMSFLVLFGILCLNIDQLETKLHAIYTTADHSQQANLELIQQLQQQLRAQQVQFQKQTQEQQMVIDGLQYQIHQLVDVRIKSREITMNVSAYTTARNETSASGLTSTMEKPVVGETCAISRELVPKLQNKRVFIEGVGVRTVNDTMAARFRNSIDLLVNSKGQARDFGRKELRIVLLD